MSAFSYSARDLSGKLTQGEMQGVSSEEVGAQLRASGLYPVSIQKLGRGGGKAKPKRKGHDGAMRHGAVVDGVTPKAKPSGKIKRGEVVSFAHQLAVMLDTGVPIAEAMESITTQTANPALQGVLEQVTETIQGGDRLATALAEHPKVFPNVMVSLVEASEASGSMGVMLERVSDYLAKEQAIIGRIRGALTYPAVMLAIALLVVVGLMVFILPRFSKMYAAKGAALPGPTRVMMWLSDSLIHHWYYWVGGIVLLIGVFIVWVSTEAGKNVLAVLQLRTPVIGGLFQKLFVARACRTMGTMLDAGVPILEMVGIVRRVTNNRLFDAMWDNVTEHLERGGQLSDALRESDLIPSQVVQMISSGEKSGRMGSVLSRVADYAEQEFDAQVKAATQLIEPVMIVAMGVFIGFLAIALLLPVFQAGQTMS